MKRSRSRTGRSGQISERDDWQVVVDTGSNIVWPVGIALPPGAFYDQAFLAINPVVPQTLAGPPPTFPVNRAAVIRDIDLRVDFIPQSTAIPGNAALFIGVYESKWDNNLTPGGWQAQNFAIPGDGMRDDWLFSWRRSCWFPTTTGTTIVDSLPVSLRRRVNCRLGTGTALRFVIASSNVSISVVTAVVSARFRLAQTL
jgi:hypothetical protein